MRRDAAEISNMLAARHSMDKAVFVPECKMGASGSRILDAWVLLKTWSPPTSIGYEIKVNRSDFTNDRKWQMYLPVCHEFYFACPAKLIQPEELPPAVGLLWTAGERLVMKRKAARREVEPEPWMNLVAYVLMSRTRIVGDMWGAQRQTDGEYWRQWAADREVDIEVGRIASARIKEKLRKAISDQAAAERRHESLSHIEERLRELGLDPKSQAGTWALNARLFGNTQAAKRALRDARALVSVLEEAEAEAQRANDREATA